MEIIDAVDSYKQYVLVEKGLSRQTWTSYLEDIQAFSITLVIRRRLVT